MEITGLVSFHIQLGGGQLIKRHQDHIQHRVTAESTPGLEDSEIAVDTTVTKSSIEQPLEQENHPVLQFRPLTHYPMVCLKHC